MSKPIYILCLWNVRTGGPEAIHQLSDALIEQGFDARMVYYDWDQIARLEQSPPQDGYTFGERANPIGEYERYKVNVCDHVPNVSDAVVVLPETLCHLAPKFDKATVLIWWLSVDNAFGSLAKVNLNHLRAPNVQHAAQSVYANRVIVSLQFIPAPGAFLTDYSANLQEYATPLPWGKRPKLAVFNANHKVVTADLDAVFAGIAAHDPEIECLRLSGASRSRVAALFASARVYADLGSFPGKDRLPREAQRMGCIPILRPHGAGHTDFDESAYVHCYEGDEVRLVVEAMSAAPEPYSVNERTQFAREVRAVFTPHTGHRVPGASVMLE